MLRICIDPGHGGRDRGMTTGKRHESDDVLKLALLLREKLLAQSIDVVITRTGNTEVSAERRCLMANKTHCCLFLSLHRASLDGIPHGVSGWISSAPDERSRRTAAALTEAVSRAVGFADLGVHSGTPSTHGYKDFTLNSLAEMPSVHLEIGSVESVYDNKSFDEKMEDCAKSITEALCKITGTRYNPRANSACLYNI